MDFDYIVVGGGSGGCAVASRLSEDPAVSVCLLEAGPADTSGFVHVPFGTVAMLPTSFNNWAYKTEPQPGLDGRRGYQPRGKVLGGSGSINAMIYIRGHHSDYEDWAAHAPGWGWQEVLPYFLRSEHNERGADEWHGSGGPLNVADVRSGIGITPAFLDAGVQAGHVLNPDFNGPSQEGVGMYQVTQKNGRRWSPARAYLSLADGRSNLTVLTSTRALRLRLDGKTCTGVDVLVRGKQETLKAKREVVLAGGAFASPQLLLLSGIGPAGELARHGIPLRHELPGVGANLQDHIDYVADWTSPHPQTVGLSPGGAIDLIKGIGPFRREGRGILTTNFAEAGGFLKTNTALSRPDIQLHFVVGIVDDHARKPHITRGYSCHVCVLRPRSRGSLRLTSADPLAAPRIDPGFLSEEEDARVLHKGVRMVLDIMGQPALDPFRGKNLYGEDRLDDDALRRLIRRRADTVYHPVGTCRMGTDDMAVVDPQLRVHGLTGLRIADASIYPTLIGGNTNAPTMMIGERAADFIRKA